MFAGCVREGWGGEEKTVFRVVKRDLLTVRSFPAPVCSLVLPSCRSIADFARAAIKYLQKMKSKSGATSWKSQLEAKMQEIDPKIRELCKKLLAYDNVPTKQKAFVNFAKNSLALQRQPQLAEKMWEVVGDLLKKPTAQLQAAAENEEKEDDEVKQKKQKKNKESEAVEEEEDGEKDKKKKKKKKDKKKDEDSSKSDEDVEEEMKSKKPKSEKNDDEDDSSSSKKKKEEKKESKTDGMELDEDDEKSKKKPKTKDE